MRRSGKPLQTGWGRSSWMTARNTPSDPPTHWFCAKTDTGRMLKIVYVRRDDTIFLKTAYEPALPTVAFYRRMCLAGRS